MGISFILTLIKNKLSKKIKNHFISNKTLSLVIKYSIDL